MSRPSLFDAVRCRGCTAVVAYVKTGATVGRYLVGNGTAKVLPHENGSVAVLCPACKARTVVWWRQLAA